MELNADGLVFVDLEYNSGSHESINIASITRLRQMSKEQCKIENRKWPTLKISIIGVNEDLIIGNLALDDFKKQINEAIKKHYDNILENELLS